MGCKKHRIWWGGISNFRLRWSLTKIRWTKNCILRIRRYQQSISNESTGWNEQCLHLKRNEH